MSGGSPAKMSCQAPQLLILQALPVYKNTQLGYSMAILQFWQVWQMLSLDKAHGSMEPHSWT